MAPLTTSLPTHRLTVHITLLVAQRASAINVFLIIRFHVKGCAPRAILSSIGSP
jgi:hypothetical protein